MRINLLIDRFLNCTQKKQQQLHCCKMAARTEGKEYCFACQSVYGPHALYNDDYAHKNKITDIKFQKKSGFALHDRMRN